MLPHLLPIGALLLGTGLLLLGSGLLSTLLALRGSLEGFQDQTLGFMGSAYFLGFVLGTYAAPPLIRRMGHVRAFAFFAAAGASITLLHALLVEPGFWMLLRMGTGLALVGLYTAIESWLTSQAPAQRRSQIFAVYMAVNLGALAAAQQLLRLDSPLAFTLFAMSAIFTCIALMPVAASRLPPPQLVHTPRLTVRRLWQAAPMAAAGAAASGLAMGAFWGLGPVYAARVGLDQGGIAMFMSAAILGGAVLQWPIGHYSDRADRRRVLGTVAATATAGALLMAALGAFGPLVLVGAFAFGSAAFAVYPLVIAHLVDHLGHDDILSGNAAVLFVNGIAAAIGPALAGLLMGLGGPGALPVFLALAFGGQAAYTLWQARRGADHIVEEPAHFMPMLRTSPTVLEMISPEAATQEPAPAADEPSAADEPAAAQASAAAPAGVMAGEDPDSPAAVAHRVGVP